MEEAQQAVESDGRYLGEATISFDGERAVLNYVDVRFVPDHEKAERRRAVVAVCVSDGIGVVIVDGDKAADLNYGDGQWTVSNDETSQALKKTQLAGITGFSIFARDAMDTVSIVERSHI